MFRPAIPLVRCLVLVALGLWVNATTLNASGFRVLVFTKTLVFRHDSIPNGIAAVRALGAANNFTVTATEDATAFNDTNLTSFACVIFLSTTGEVLDSTQQAAFQRYIEAGGGFVGIHAAADTEYTWPWYGQLVGAYFKSHPAVQQATVKINDFVHPSTVGLPKRWIRTDEWYSFKTNPRGKVHVLATLDEGTYPPVDRMGFDHPTAWCHNFDGGRAWYTGGGHTQASYSEPDFLRHILGGILWAAGAQPGDADATIDTHFQKVILDATPQDPMQMSIAADGRVFYAERAGKVKMWKPDTRSTVVVGTVAIDEGREDGLLGIALDPNFVSNHWLYLFYSPPGNVSEQHVSRFTLKGETLDLASEKVLLVIPTQRLTCCHSAGGLDFGPGGNLYIGVGDNTNPFESGGFDPIDERPGRSPWDAQKSSGNMNDLRGKILRIHPEPNGTMSIPAGNLFPPGTANTRPEIYTMGNRNPFRFSIDPATGWLYWGEVGPDANNDDASRGPRGHDEWNQARSAGNYGWPYFVADNKAYREYDFATQLSGPAFNPAAPVNNSPNNTGPLNLPAARPAWIWYPYADSAEFPEVNGGGGRTAMGGPVYHYNPAVPANGRKLPSYYDKTVFIYEWSRNFIKEIKLDDQGNILKINPFLPSFSFSRPMDMKLGPDGAIYMVEWGSGFGGGNADSKIIRIDYVGGNHAPTAQASATPTAGPAPLKVQFSSAGTFDPEKDPLTYAWSFYGDGKVDSTDPNPTFQYTTPGNYQARLTVMDKNGNSAVANLAVVVGNTPPVVSIVEPPNGAFFDWGANIRFRVQAFDAEDGLVPCDQIQVEPKLGHNDHAHDEGSFPGCDGVFQAPVKDDPDTDPLFLVLRASVTDKGNPPAASLLGRTTYILQPKLKQAEHFTRTNSVVLRPTADPDGGNLEVAPQVDGGWQTLYPVHFRAIDSVTVRVESTSGGRLEFREGSPDGYLFATIAVPAGGGHSELTAPIVDVRDVIPHTFELFIVYRGTTVGEIPGLALNWMRFEGNGVSVQQGPWGEQSASIPGQVEVENFDRGGPEVAYHDNSPGNQDGAYRTDESVDIEVTTDTEGGFDVTHTEAGEWLDYTVNVQPSGLYDLETRFYTREPGGVFHLEFNGVDKTGPIVLPALPSVDPWLPWTRTGLALDAGVQTLRLKFDTNAPWGGAGRLNYLRFRLTKANRLPTVSWTTPAAGSIYSYPADITLTANATDSDGTITKVEFYQGQTLIGVATKAPYSVVWEDAASGDYTLTARAIDNLSGSAVSSALPVHIVRGAAPYRAVPSVIPGTIQAEDYDIGGEGIAYHDGDVGNNGGQYRPDAVDIEKTSDAGGGFNVGWTGAGEWLEYTLSSPFDGIFTIQTRVASAGVGGKFHLELDGIDVTGPLTSGDTGGWQKWKTLTKAGVPISEGRHVLKVAMDSIGASGNTCNLNWIHFIATTITPPPFTLCPLLQPLARTRPNQAPPTTISRKRIQFQ